MTVTEAHPADTLSASSSFLSALPDPARESLVASARRLRVDPGQVVIREGDASGGYHLVVEGSLEVWESRQGKGDGVPEPGQPWTPNEKAQKLVATLGPGDGFGEMSMLMGGRRRATVRSVTAVELLVIDSKAFKRALAQHRGIRINLEEEMALRVASDFLGRSSPFASLDPEALRYLAVHMRRVDLEAGEVAVRQGDPGDAFFIVESGVLEVIREEADGERALADLEMGDVFGEQALVTGEPRAATVRAGQRSRLLRLDRADFESVLARHADRARYFVQLTMQRQRPRRIDDWSLERRREGGATVLILRDNRSHRYLRISEQGAFLWDLMDGRHTVRDLSMAYFERFGAIGLDVVLGAMTQLSLAGFVSIQHIDAARLGLARRLGWGQRLGTALMPWIRRYFSMPDVDAPLTWLYRHGVRLAYTRAAQALLLLVTLGGAAVFVQRLAAGTLVPHSVSAGWVALALLLGMYLQIILHESAHAFTCKHFGREVHRAGVGYYLFMPVAFVDTSDIWMEGKLARIAVSIAGPYMNLFLAGLAGVLTLFTRSAAIELFLVNFALVGYMLGLLNLNPLIEFDGYYVLMDWLEIPNLRTKALAFLGTVIWRAPRTTGDPRLVRIFSVFGLLSLTYTIFVAASILAGYHGFVQGWAEHVLPEAGAAVLGWSLALLMTWLIVVGAWRDLRARVAEPALGGGSLATPQRV